MDYFQNQPPFGPELLDPELGTDPELSPDSVAVFTVSVILTELSSYHFLTVRLVSKEPSSRVTVLEIIEVEMTFLPSLSASISLIYLGDDDDELGCELD